MAFWHRIGNSKLKIACTQTLFRRCYIHLPHSSALNPTPIPRPFPYWGFHDRPTAIPTYVCHSVRFFAAPIQFQAKQKKEEDNSGGPRLNDEIKAQYIRLVRDDGHSIVSRFEALELARRLKLDLVEVQRDAKPPVCKIMDFHKVMYEQQEKQKERAKSKSGVTLRKGECKEVRVSEKTELKDLKMKADMVKKLMEKGYRVKCKAIGNESQDMTASLSRLHALIEDVSVVESGPHQAKKEAYMIVRHIKYGPAKKSGGKKSQDATAHMDVNVKAQESNVEPDTANSNDPIEYDNQISFEPWFETNDLVSPAEPENRYKKAIETNDSVSPAEPENRYKKANRSSENNGFRSAQVAHAAVTENRYRRAEPKNRFQQTPFHNTGPERRDAVRSIPSVNHTRHHVPQGINFNLNTENTKQTFIPGSRNSRPPSFEDIPLKHTPSHPSAPNIPRPGGFGIFSSSKGSETQAGMHRNREVNSQDSTRQTFRRDSQ